MLGIHRDKLLPDFAPTTFERWAEQNGRVVAQPGGDEAVLFQTCYVQNNEPQIGRDTLEVLEQNQVTTACVKGLAVLRHAGLGARRPRVAAAPGAHATSSGSAPFVERGRQGAGDQPDLLDDDAPRVPGAGAGGAIAPRARKLAAAVRDPGEFLWSIRNEPRFNTDFKTHAGRRRSRTTRPATCARRRVGFKGRDLLRKIPGVQPKIDDGVLRPRRHATP